MHVLNAATAALFAQTPDAIAVIAQRNSMLANGIRDFTDVYLEVSSSLAALSFVSAKHAAKVSH